MRIRAATDEDIAVLPALQVAAGAAFRGLGMDVVADGPPPPVVDLHRARTTGDLLVAVRQEKVVGFVRTTVLDASLHVVQLSVAPDHQRRGIGRSLMRAAERSAASRGFARMTLTTFRDVPFNGPFYARLGWVELAAESVTAGLAAEREDGRRAGLDRWPRIAMGKAVSA